MGRSVSTFFLSIILLSLSAQNQESKPLSAEDLQEKIYLHTDKAHFYPGETIWFSGYVNYKSTALISILSKVMYVDLINSDNIILMSLILKIDSGRTEGNFNLPSDSSPGVFIIRAYTNWMNNYGVENFSYTPIQILNLNEIADKKTLEEIDTCSHLKITFDKASYTIRDKVRMTVSLILPNDSALVSLSVAVTDDSQVANIEGRRNILNDFKIDKYPPQGMLSPFKYRIERGVGMEGSYLNRKGKGEKVTLSIVQNNFENIYVINTNDYGDFFLRDLTFYDSMRFGIQSVKGKVILKTRELPQLPNKLPTIEVALAELKSGEQQRLYYDTGKSILLHDVKIKASRLRPTAENNRQKIDFYITGKDIATYTNMAAAVQSKIPGYNLVYNNLHTYLVWLRGEYSKENGPPIEPIVYIDDNEMLNMVGGETIGDRLALLDPSIIDHIEAASTSNTGLGATGSLGVLFIYTKSSKLTDSKSIPIFWVKGFNRPNIFQSTDYSNLPLQKNIDDFRSTLYWNSRIDLSKQKNSAELSFFTSDQDGKYTIIIEGVTTKGMPLRIAKKITVEN